jgi:uncharacterized protein
MSEILKKVLEHMPEDLITDAGYEAANIVLYTKDKRFFLESGDLVRKVVSKVKKRIEIRPDPAICMEREAAEKELRKLIPEEAAIDLIIFDDQRSQVIIECEKPGLAIGKGGEMLQAIKETITWLPVIKRTPPIRSSVIENIRSVLYQNSDYRRKFLNRVGERVYNGRKRPEKQDWVRLSYLGGGRQVGRSCLLLQTPESRVLFDCGIDVSSSGEDMYPVLNSPDFNIQDLDAVVVSHAHLDHTGFIPYLFKFGYRGPVYCTLPTRDIMVLLQLDTIKIARYENQEPLYSSEDIKQQVLHTVPLDYGEVMDLTPDVRITFHNSGHMIGSAMVHIHVGNGLHNIVYTGDIKYAKTFLLSPATTRFPRCETLILEATYGGKDNTLPPPGEQDDIFAGIIKTTMERGGKLLMPVLGSGRGQEVLVQIHQMVRDGLIKPYPVYIDGMVWDITAIHTAYPEFMNGTMRNKIFAKDDNPFLADYIKRVGSPKERQEVVESDEPCIVLATSGMLVGGASVEYLKELAEQKKNSLVFSSYLGPGSLGRRIHDGEREIAFQKPGGGQEILHIRMEVHKIEITGHADRTELMQFFKRLQPRPRRVLLNHGEQSRCLDLASTLHKKYRVHTLAPDNLEAVRLR